MMNLTVPYLLVIMNMGIRDYDCCAGVSTPISTIFISFLKKFSLFIIGTGYYL